MMNDGSYYDFRLWLKYFRDINDENKEKILVVREGTPPAEPALYETLWIDTTTNKPLEGTNGLIEMGSRIADMLLPGPIRDQFIEKWQYGNQKIRLRLQYPLEEFESENDVQTQITKLAKIPWEYIYLYEHPDDNPLIGVRTRFLGLRDEISIVHSLRPYSWSLPKPSTVDQLKVKMKYFSWLGSGDEQKNRDIRQGFVNEFSNLRAIFEHPSINDTHLQDLATIPAESHRLRTALQNDDFIHITCHGDADGISLLDGEYNQKEWLQDTDLIRKIKAKVIILLSCDTAGGDIGGGLISKLNRGGVPITIGMTKNINFEAAERFVKGFYNALATWPVDGTERAIVYGRLGISNLELDLSGASQDDFEAGNWHAGFGMPRLFLNGNDSTLIPSHLLYTPVTKMVERFEADIQAVTELDDDNTRKWQEMMKSWINQDQSAPQRQWLLVTGPAGEGKTTQIKLLLKSLKSVREPCLKQLKSDNQQETDEAAVEDAATPIPPTGGEVPVDEQGANSEDANTANPIVCPQKMLFHFCDDDCPQTIQALYFVCDSLVHQLQCLYGQDYLDVIPVGRYPRLVYNADLALWDFVIKPLEALIMGDENGNRIEPPVIVIDGLDAVPKFQDPANSISGLLFRYRDRLEEVARFLVNADYIELNSRDIDGRQAKRLDEVSTNIYELTHHEYNDDDIIRMVNPDSPSILFQVMLKRFEKGDLLPSTLPDQRHWHDFYNLLDLTVEKAIDVTIKDTQHSEAYWQKHLLRFLNIAAIAFEPLPSPDVAAIAGLSPDGPEKKHLLFILLPFFRDIQADEANSVTEDNVPLSFYHKRLRSYFLSQMRYKYDKESLADTHMLLVDAFRAGSGQWADLNWHTLAGSKWPRLSEEQIESISPYLHHYYMYHAYYSCYYTSWGKLGMRRTRAKVFLDLICDSGFREMRRDKVGRREAVQDIWLGLRIISAEYIHHSHQRKDYFHTKARVAFDRLLEANRPNTYSRNKLIRLEELLRNQPEKNWIELFRFLGFKKSQDRTWWNDLS